MQAEQGRRDRTSSRLSIAVSGIDRATAIALAAKGAELFLTDINAVGLEDTVALIRRGGGGKVLLHRALDVSSYPAVQDFATDIHTRYGSLDIVMNIAGIAIWVTIEHLQHSQWNAASTSI